MARIALLVLVVAAAAVLEAKAADDAVQPAGEELTLDKAARAKKDAGYPYGGTGSYNTGYSYNRGYNSAYPTAPGYTGYNQDWARTYNQYVDPRYQYQQPGFYPTADPRYSNYYNRGYNTAGYPGYNGYGGYDARTATGYGGYNSAYGGSRYPYEDRFYSNYPYNGNYNRYPNDYNRRTNYDSRYPYQGAYPGAYPASGVGGYNTGYSNYNNGYNYNSGYGSYPNYPVTQEYYYSPAASNNVYNTGYGSRYLKKRDGKDPAVAASAEAPVVGQGPTPTTPVA